MLKTHFALSITTSNVVHISFVLVCVSKSIWRSLLRYGFYFDSPATATSACAAISTTLASLDQHKPPPPPRPSSLAAPATAPATDVAPKRRRSLADFSVVEEFATTATDASSTPPALPAANSANPAAPPAIPPLPPAIPPALPAIPASDSSRPTSYENDNNISLPINVNHKMKVTFNATWSRYEGLPVEWAAYNKQFGVPLCDLPKIIVPDYEQSIPTVLVMLQRLFVSLNGPMTTGIFRLAPDKDKCQMVKEAINCGSFNGENVDVHIIANLIKVFFRDLPEGLFNSIPTDLIHQLAATPLSTLISTLYTHLPPSTHALTYYLLDLMALVVLNEHTNRMSAKNMAIVVSPNLYTVNTENPMVALTMAQKVADFTTQLLLARLELKFQYVPTSSS